MADNIPKIIVIAGPTASGKTSVALDLAEAVGGEIVSADSVQVYRLMDIGSAKPTAYERSRVPHHMIDIRYPDEEFSAADYVREGRQCVNDVLSRGGVPIVTGGTGLYIRLLLGGVVDMPPSDPRVRAKIRAEAEAPGKLALFERLRRVDPDSALEIGSHNLSRIVRALEVFELTGRTISSLRRAHGLRDRAYDALFVCLAPDRRVLYERIDKRVDIMVKEGLLKEVSILYQRGFSPELKPLQSLGYRHAGMILSGKADPDEAIRLMKRDTRRYAKRQITWFRSEPEAVWCDPGQKEGIGLMVDNFLGQ